MTPRHAWCALGIAASLAVSVAAQVPLSRGELDRVVAPIALYPDPLLARVLTASTFAADVPAAERWAHAHRGLSGASLAAAMTEERLPWDISVQALLPFPSVLNDMSSDMAWTTELGSAFALDRAGVTGAVQRMRRRALMGGDVLSACSALVVRDTSQIEIAPADPGYIVVPVYDALAVFEPSLTSEIRRNQVYCGAGVRLDSWFAAWGWNRGIVRERGSSGESGESRGAR